MLCQPDWIRQALKLHFARYYQYNVAPQSDVDQEALDDMNDLSTTAFEVFKALFTDHTEFYDESSTKAFLGTATSADDAVILYRLFDWVQELIGKFCGQNGVIVRTGYTPDELAKNIERFVKPSSTIVDDDGRSIPSLWPVVSMVKVGLRSPLLERGLVIADLPGEHPSQMLSGDKLDGLTCRALGLSDVNKLRTSLTIDYMRRCKFGLLIAPIARVQTDNLVHKRLGDIYRTFGPNKALLVTKIDVSSGLSTLARTLC